jgi:hypothetical protein
MNAMRAWLQIALSPPIFRRALATCAVVGIVLTLANHGEEVFGGRLRPDHAWPIALTFIVPFVVATISDTAAISRPVLRRQAALASDEYEALGTLDSNHTVGSRRIEPVKASDDVRGAMLEFYERLSAKDVASFDRLVSDDPATLVIGTAPGEWVTERDRLRFGFEAEGLAIEAGARPAGYEQRDIGWFVDEPTYTFPDGSRMRTRLTAVLLLEQGDWRIVHMHVSVGVPDDEVVALQARWAS